MFNCLVKSEVFLITIWVFPHRQKELFTFFLNQDIERTRGFTTGIQYIEYTKQKEKIKINRKKHMNFHLSFSIFLFEFFKSFLRLNQIRRARIIDFYEWYIQLRIPNKRKI